MQHLDRRLEHLDEFHKTLRRAVQAAGIRIGIGIVLAEKLELANIDLADETRNILVVFVPRFGLGDADLLQPRRLQAHNRKLGDISAKLLQSFHGPGRDRAGQPSYRDSVALLEFGPERYRIDQAERTFEDGADLVARFQDIDRLLLH